MFSLTAIAVSVLPFVLGYYFLQKRRNSPPGPWGLPFLGNLLSLNPQFHISFEKWGKQYGSSVVKIKLGSYDAVILKDIATIREAFAKPTFSGRPALKLSNLFSGGKHGISASDGNEWVEQRRFTLKNLRDMGFGKKSMESMIMDEVKDVLGWMKENDGKAVSVNRKFSLAVINALVTILSGKRYDQEDPILKNIMDTTLAALGEATKSGFIFFMPQLTAWFPQLFGWEKVEAAVIPFLKFFDDIVDDHIRSEKTKDSMDFTYAYLEKIKNTTDPSSSFYKDTGRISLTAVLGDLYNAGSGSITTTLAWVVLYLMMHPEVQSKLQAELDKVTGKTRTPCLEDRPNTPYAEAIVQETLRHSSIIPYSIFHNTTEDVEFRGYNIAKDTIIIPNLHAVHHDVKTWGDPENFRPERFLAEDGKTVKRNEASVAFSVGKRVCPAETLARDQIYLFLTNIFYKFRALEDPVDPKPSLEPNGSFLLEAKPFTVIFKERL